MTSQGRMEIEQAESWKELLLQLPGIVSAEFVFGEEGSIRELHVLSAGKRSPKQVVRDIESAMMAKFGVEIDHRLISVAQLSEEALPGAGPSEKRLVCSGMDLSIRSDNAEICVELTYEDSVYRGKAKAGPKGSARRRATAEAAVEAVNQYGGGAFCARVSEVKTVEIAEQTAVLVAVSFTSRKREELLLGSCFQWEEDCLPVVRATLDALNRRISFM